MATVMTDKELASELFDTVCALEAENADLRSGEYLARVIEGRDRYRKALEFYAKANSWRSSTVYMCGHSGASSAEIDRGNKARAALESTNEPT